MYTIILGLLFSIIMFFSGTFAFAANAPHVKPKKAQFTATALQKKAAPVKNTKSKTIVPAPKKVKPAAVSKKSNSKKTAVKQKISKGHKSESLVQAHADSPPNTSDQSTQLMPLPHENLNSDSDFRY